jgi:hypothetical protein
LPRLAPRNDGYTVEAELSIPATWRGWGWPESVTVKYKTEDDVAVVLKGEMTPDGPVMTSVSLTGANIRPPHLRLPFNSVLRGAFAAAAHGPRQDGGYSNKSGIVLKVPVGSGRPIDVTSARQRLDEVAAVHANTPRGERGKAVSEAMGVSMNYARALIHEARKVGLIQ